jgi:hypothetical protein
MAITVTTPNFTFRRGNCEFVRIPTAASTLYNPGDLIWNNNGVAAIASAFTWTTDLATTQPLFRAKFLGVCMDLKLATDPSTNSILVCTRGFFSYPCAALGSALHIGAFVNAAKDPGANALATQLLANVSGNTLAIGTLAEEAASGATILNVYLQSFAIYGGIGA